MVHSIFPTSSQMAAVFRFIEENYRQPITLCDIAQAIYLLQKTEQTIGQIAESIGYQDICHFSRYFRQFYGTSPQAWRNEHLCCVAAS
ncbi:AraC family transcriptional regulator [Scytonema millei]|uniref:AraC family transcriptional regulator n=1 Tax=Scytonema millei TaxID=1245922 RepID=UPI00269A76C7|nr:AraC family transcriptional regulator [Scytonema millei]